MVEQGCQKRYNYPAITAVKEELGKVLGTEITEYTVLEFKTSQDESTWCNFIYDSKIRLENQQKIVSLKIRSHLFHIIYGLEDAKYEEN